MSTVNVSGQLPVFRLTDAARAEVVVARADEPDPEGLALWVEVSGISAAGTDYTYDLSFRSVTDAGPNDVVQPHDDVSVVIPRACVDELRGATLDLSAQEGLVIINPNRPSSALAGGPSNPLSEMARRVQQVAEREASVPIDDRVRRVIDNQINPSIAAHGGHAELVAVQDGTAYVRLSGGCQGCGLASVTLTQGIDVTIKEWVPEIAQVIDVTDHASGTNPYYEGSPT